MNYNEAMAILDKNPEKHLTPILESRNKGVLSEAYIYIMEQTGCELEIAKQIVDEIISDFADIKPYVNNSPTVSCPYCQSTDTKKISGTSRFMSTGIFGLASGKIGKNYHCNKCKSDF